MDRYIKLVEKISFQSAVEFDVDLAAVHKTRSNLDKFNYIRIVLLQKAKLFIYKAIYENWELLILTLSLYRYKFYVYIIALFLLV